MNDKAENFKGLKFSNTIGKNFESTLRKRVSEYFKEKGVSKFANSNMKFKTAFMLVLYFLPYFLVMFGVITNPWLILVCWGFIGFGMAGIGMNVMHDGNHGSYSKKSWVNKVMGGTIYFLAGNVYNWQVQHNVLHHTYTNVHGHDEDLDAGRVIRFSEHAKWRKFHKFQHYYSIFLYGLLTFNWAITTDFKQSRRYLAQKLSYGKLPSPLKQWSTIAITKLIYVTLWIVIPILFSNLAWWQVLIGFFVMHYTAGLILSVVFQLAHIVDHTEMPLPDEDGNMKNTWAIHQLMTTTNFSTKNKIVNWFTGGLNHQVEHHIFPNISHIHYTKISEIVRNTAKEFNLPYHEYETTRSAIKAHFLHLKQMGAKPTIAA